MIRVTEYTIGAVSWIGISMTGGWRSRRVREPGVKGVRGGRQEEYTRMVDA